MTEQLTNHHQRWRQDKKTSNVLHTVAERKMSWPWPHIFSLAIYIVRPLLDTYVANVRHLITRETEVHSDTLTCKDCFFCLKWSFATLTPNIFLLLYKALIRPHLEYTIQAPSPHSLPGLPCTRKCSKICGDVCKWAAPRAIWGSSAAAAALFPSSYKNPWWPHLNAQNNARPSQLSRLYSFCCLHPPWT